MKNKIFTKIVLVVVCLSTLLVTFVVPSFAYTVTEPSALYNDRAEVFNLPGFNAINLKNVNTYIDVPDVLTVPIADNSARTATSLIASFKSNLDGSDIFWSIQRLNNIVNYYETGYVLNGEIEIASPYYHDYEFDYYILDSIVLRDYRFNSTDDLVSGAPCGIEISLYEPELFEQKSFNNYFYSLKVNYNYKYYDEDGDYHTTSFDTKIYGFDGDFGDDFTHFYLPYFPKQYYDQLDETFINDSKLYNNIYSNGLVYLEELVITIDMDDYDLNFMNESHSYFDIAQTGIFVNRLNPSNANSLNGIIENSFDLGYTRGKSDGYEDGFRSAVEQGEFDVFDGLLNGVNSFIEWEFIPGISVGVVISVVIGVSLLIAFLKIFAGG